MINITKQELQLLINKVGLTKASKQLRCGYSTIKKMCIDYNIDINKKQAGRKRNINLMN